MNHRTILVVEEDQALQHLIMRVLEAENYGVLCVRNAALAETIAQDNPFSLILLDGEWQLSEGVDLCRRLRAAPETAHTPILLLVADETDITRLIQLNLGIDDYLVKPFIVEELRACAAALLRAIKRRPRQRFPRGLENVDFSGKGEPVLVVDDLSINIPRRQIIYRGRRIDLRSALLFKLLVYLVHHRGMVFSREHLLTHVWGYDPVHAHDTRTVDVHIRWLREKLEDDADDPQLIQTVRGVGYVFR